MTWQEYEAKQGIVSIPIRPGVAVSIGPMPTDLTKQEADKLARVVRAFASEK